MADFKIKSIGKAGFTRDMAETLLTYFDHYSCEGVVSIEVTSHGLWLCNPHTTTRQFLGRADFPDQPVTYSPQIMRHRND